MAAEHSISTESASAKRTGASAEASPLALLLIFEAARLRLGRLVGAAAETETLAAEAALEDSVEEESEEASGPSSSPPL